MVPMSTSAGQATKWPVVPARAAGEPRVLSIGQQRLWYLSQLTPNNAAYNVPYASRIHGPVDSAALKKAFEAIIERHEVLRTVILGPGGSPVPVLPKKWAFDLKCFDIRNFPADLREPEAERIVKQEAGLPFNLTRDLMLRGVLIRLADEEHILLHIAPHMSFEGGSLIALFHELEQFYNHFVYGDEVSVPEMTLQYCDYALWQRRYLEGERLEKLTEYWKKQLTGAPLVNLPLDFPRPTIHTMRGTRHPMVLPAQLLSRMNQFFRDSGTTPYRGLCAAFNVFLHCYTGLTDISVGSPFFPRCSGVEHLIGFFVNTVVVRNDLSGDPTFRTLMKRVDDVVRGAIQHSDLTFDKLVEAVRPPRDSSRTPLFQVNFRAPKEPYPTLRLKGLTCERVQYKDNGTAKFDLALEVESSLGQACYFEYCVDLFKPETIEQMVVDFHSVLSGVMDQPDMPLSEVSVVREIQSRIRARSKF
jgi:condensation domain-containing protein